MNAHKSGISIAEAKKRVENGHKSIGLDNIRKRLEHASVIQGRKISLDISEETDDDRQLKWPKVTIQIALA